MASPEAGPDQEGVLGEFRFRSGCLVGVILVFGAQVLWWVLLAISLRRDAPATEWLLPWQSWTALGLAALMSLPVVLYSFTRANAVLRISEEGLSYRGARGGSTSIAWDQIVALHTGSGTWHNWFIRYRRETDGKLRILSLPPLVGFTPLRVGAALRMVRGKASLTRDVRSFWKWSLWGLGWERE